MDSILDKVKNILLKDERLVSGEGDLLKNKIQELALKLDKSFIKLLFSDEEIKNVFFQDIDGVFVFDNNKFISFINNSEFLPDNYTAFKNKIGLANSNGDLLGNSNDIVLNRPYKDCVLEFDSTDENLQRDEIFYNEVLAKDQIDKLLDPKVFTNFKKYTKDGEQELTEWTQDENGNIKDNLIIKGNNLLALHSLLQKYKGEVKLMYRDILYNTESDKVPYADKFKHSTWLTMMKNRLEIAQKLLKSDGIICLQCDDNEQAYLKVICDEIFSRDNYLNTLVVEMASTGGLKRSHKDKRFLKTKEYILVYSNSKINNINCLYDEWSNYDSNYTIFFTPEGGIQPLKKNIGEINPLYKNLSPSQYLGFQDIYDYLIDNRERIFRRHNPSSRSLENVSSGEVLREDESKPTRNQVIKVKNPENDEEFELLMRIKQNNSYGYERLEPLSWNFYDNKFKLLRGDLRKDYYKDMGNVSKEGGVKLSNGKKPERLLSDIMKAFTNEGDIVLDAYFGTGTTGAVALKTNRKFIGIEQLELHFDKAIARLKNVLNGDESGISVSADRQGGEFISCELLKNNELIMDKIEGSDNKEDLLKIYEDIKNSDFLSYKVDINQIDENISEFTNLSIENMKCFLREILDKNSLYVNYSEIDDTEYGVSAEDKKLNNDFYNKQ